jgi:hypothetical protein
MPPHVRQVAGLFPSARRETRRYWKPFKGDFKIGGNPVKRVGGAVEKAGRSFYHEMSQFGEGVVNIVASPYYHYADYPNTGYAYGKKQLAGSAQTVALTAILSAYAIDAASTPGSTPPAGDTPYPDLPGSVDMPYGADYPGMPSTVPTPGPTLPAPTGLESGSIDMPYGANYPGADLSPTWTDKALGAGKYIGEKIGLPLALKLLMPAAPSVGSPGGGYSIYNQAGGSEGGGSGSPGGGGGFFSGLDEPGALGLPVWATYVIAALVLGVAIAAAKRKG